MPDEPSDDVAMLREYLRERDVTCPLCRYNLRNLTQPKCPECEQELTISVGLRQTRIGWFLAAISPGIFSGIAAALLVIPITVVPATGGGRAPWFILAIDGFGWLSGIAAVLLAVFRNAFLRLPDSTQRWAAMLTWTVHLLAAALVMIAILS